METDRDRLKQIKSVDNGSKPCRTDQNHGHHPINPCRESMVYRGVRDLAPRQSPGMGAKSQSALQDSCFQKLNASHVTLSKRDTPSSSLARRKVHEVGIGMLRKREREREIERERKRKREGYQERERGSHYSIKPMTAIAPSGNEPDCDPLRGASPMRNSPPP